MQQTIPIGSPARVLAKQGAADRVALRDETIGLPCGGAAPQIQIHVRAHNDDCRRGAIVGGGMYGIVQVIWQLLLTSMLTQGIIHDATATILTLTRAAEWLRPRIVQHTANQKSSTNLASVMVELRLEDTRGLG
jgi:hypothetical protein